MQFVTLFKMLQDRGVIPTAKPAAPAPTPVTYAPTPMAPETNLPAAAFTQTAAPALSSGGNSVLGRISSLLNMQGGGGGAAMGPAPKPAQQALSYAPAPRRLPAKAIHSRQDAMQGAPPEPVSYAPAPAMEDPAKAASRIAYRGYGAER